MATTPRAPYVKKEAHEGEPITALAWFRIVFGGLMAIECFGAIATGWVRETFVEPRLTFPMHGLEFLAGLSGEWMFGYFAAMGLASFGVALGARYRACAFTLAVLWTGAYLAQKTRYNNHYYLAALFAWWMAVLPAHRALSLDVARGRVPRADRIDAVVPRLFRVLVLIVFTFAAIAKLDPGWLNGDYLRVRLGSKGDQWPLGGLVVRPGFQSFTVWSAIVFDAGVVPLLMWRRTRGLAVLGLLLFNLFNSIVFRIGIFPYLVLGLVPFFFPDRLASASTSGERARAGSGLRVAAVVFLLVQVFLPLRHHLIPGDVTWTEEGHRLSWRMMVRTKAGAVALEARDPATGERWPIDLGEWLTNLQRQRVATQPEFLHQFAVVLREHYAVSGRPDVGIFVTHSAVSLNGTPARALYAADVDVSAVPWSHGLRREPWVLDRR